jgi:hypothetical protein
VHVQIVDVRPESINKKLGKKLADFGLEAEGNGQMISNKLSSFQYSAVIFSNTKTSFPSGL